jgi:hypothetical protein
MLFRAAIAVFVLLPVAAQAQEFEKVGEMYETMGDLLRLLSKKIKAYQRAL